MGRPRKLTHAEPIQLRNLVTIAYVEDVELAERYKYLLLENAVPVVIRKAEPDQRTKFSDIVLQVPEEFLDQAYDLLARQAVFDDFFETFFNSDRNQSAADTDEDE